MKKYSIIIVLLLCISILCACGNEHGQDASTGDTTPPASGDVKYCVSVVDPVGNPVTSGVIVNFMSGENNVGMQTTNLQGVAELTLSRGTYTVQLAFVDSSAQYYFDTENLTLTPENSSLKIVLCNAPVVDEKTYTTYDPETGVESSYTEYLYHAGVGYTHIPLTADVRNYVYFTPTESGLYQFSVLEKDTTIGYYGSPFFILGDSAAELDDNGAFTINVTKSMIGSGNTGTSILVLGIDAGSLENCILSIQRIGDAELTIEDMPWETYSATFNIQPYTLPAGANIQNFDLTATGYTLVLNETDGYYHLNTADGPIVYAKLGVASDYLDSIQTILDNSGISRYYYDDSGNFVKKVTFSECLLNYISAMDSGSGLYPLTQDLAYIFKERGEYVGWWDVSSPGFVFKDKNGNPVPGINSDIAWLFLCCYDAADGEQGGSADSVAGTVTNPDAPIVLAGADALEFTVDVEPGTYVLYELYRISGADLVINHANAYVILGDQVILPVNGVIKVPMDSEGPSVPIRIGIGNMGTAKESFTVTCVYPLGSMANPETLNIGSFSTHLKEGNDAGYFYTYTAEKDGTLIIHLDAMTEGVNCDMAMYNLTSYIYLTMEADGVDNTLSITVQAGDVVQITIAALPDASYNYPAATVEATASLQ